MKMASLVILIPPAVVTDRDRGRGGEPGRHRRPSTTPGAHGFSEVLYAFSSAGNNNGSAFAGLGANTPFYNTALGLAMLFARYWLAIPTLAIAGSLARKKTVPAGPGTLPTHTPLFVALLIGVVCSWARSRSSPRSRWGRSSSTPDDGGEAVATEVDETWPHMSRRAPCSTGPSLRRALVDAFRKLDPGGPGPQPGDVRRLRGEHPDDRALAPGAPRPGGGARRLHLLDLGLALVHRPLRELRRGDGRGARQGPGRGAPPDAPGRPGQAPRAARARRPTSRACPAARCGRATSCWSRPAT